MKAVKSAGGFTLLEIIAALAMATALAGALALSLRLGLDAFRAGGDNLSREFEASAALDIIGRDLAGALPPTGILAGPFIGGVSGAGFTDTTEGEFLSFFTRPMRTGHAWPGIVGVSYDLETGGEETASLVRRLRVNLLSPHEEPPAEETICREIASLEIFFHDGEQWLESWSSIEAADTLPRAVEIILRKKENPGNPEDNGQVTERRRVYLLPCAGPGPGEAGMTAIGVRHPLLSG